LKIKAVIASSLGNIFEWYDFALFSAFSNIFAHAFFPASDHNVALLQVFAVFAMGFLCRPIGAFLFGHLGDRIGRIVTLRLSIFAITIPTFLMALLPTYAEVGIYAPIALIVLRILQGISIGGEFTGIIIYLTEIAPDRHRALLASFAGTAANLGILMASGVVMLLHLLIPTTMYLQIGWRIAFLIGAGLGILLLYLRLGIQETDIFKTLLASNNIVRLPVWSAFKKTPGIMLKTVALVMLGAVLYYLCFVYLPDYLVDIVKLSRVTALQIQSVCILAMLLLVPLGAMLCDRIGRKKGFLYISGGLLLFALPCFYLLTSKLLVAVMLAMAIFTLLSSLEQGTTSATVVEQFPAALRYTGISISYNITQALFGGTAPVIALFLINYTHNPLAPAYYLMIIAAITLVTVLFFFTESKTRSLQF
jgi:MHS family proline/betaine transporter-like MFS transporter